MLGRSWDYPVGVLHHYIFIIAQRWLTSHPRSTRVLLDTGTPGTSREIFTEDANGHTRTLNTEPSALAIELTSSIIYCWEGVEFVQLVYCIIIYLSDCSTVVDFSPETVQWFCWTQEILVPAEKFSVRMLMVRLELVTPRL